MTHDELIKIVRELVVVVHEMNEAIAALHKVAEAHDRQLGSLNAELDQLGQLLMEEEQEEPEQDESDWWK